MRVAVIGEIIHGENALVGGILNDACQTTAEVYADSYKNTENEDDDSDSDTDESEDKEEGRCFWNLFFLLSAQ